MIIAGCQQAGFFHHKYTDALLLMLSVWQRRPPRSSTERKVCVTKHARSLSFAWSFSPMYFCLCDLIANNQPTALSLTHLHMYMYIYVCVCRERANNKKSMAACLVCYLFSAVSSLHTSCIIAYANQGTSPHIVNK
jgi:hypothetical protein